MMKTKPDLASPKILVYDIETAGVNALNADLGYVITFGYIWLDDFNKGEKAKTISIADFPEFEKDPHNDKMIVKAGLELMAQADGLIHHYGNRFDHPYMRTRGVKHRIPIYTDVAALDTCHLAWKTFKLSRNSLKNVAQFLDCKYQKLEKLDGWPKWWMDFLKGSTKSDKKMREYCALDVMTLAEIAERMRPYWTVAFCNRLYVKNQLDRWGDATRKCMKCGGVKLESKGIGVRARRPCRLLKCRTCGFSGNIEKVGY